MPSPVNVHWKVRINLKIWINLTIIALIRCWFWQGCWRWLSWCCVHRSQHVWWCASFCGNYSPRVESSIGGMVVNWGRADGGLVKTGKGLLWTNWRDADGALKSVNVWYFQTFKTGKGLLWTNWRDAVAEISGWSQLHNTGNQVALLCSTITHKM